MRPITDKLLRISSGYIEHNLDLENGSEVTIIVKGTITKKEYKDNQDNSDTEICVLKGEGIEVIKQ